MIAFGLTEVVISNTVEEDHQHSPCHKEQDRSREWVNQYANLQPCIASWQPVDG
jgi:hypothetical protein